jgi:hypothetical protein
MPFLVIKLIDYPVASQQVPCICWDHPKAANAERKLNEMIWVVTIISYPE